MTVFCPLGGLPKTKGFALKNGLLTKGQASQKCSFNPGDSLQYPRGEDRKTYVVTQPCQGPEHSLPIILRRGPRLVVVVCPRCKRATKSRVCDPYTRPRAFRGKTKAESESVIKKTGLRIRERSGIQVQNRTRIQAERSVTGPQSGQCLPTTEPKRSPLGVHRARAPGTEKKALGFPR